MKDIFDDFHFLLFKIDETNNQDFIIKYLGYKDIPKKDIDNEIFSFIDKQIDTTQNFINILFYNILNKKTFTHKWNQIIENIKIYHLTHDNNLARSEYLDYLKKDNLSEFIIFFIKNNFILRKNSTDITNNIDLWYQADEIIPNNIFYDQRILFEAYNINYKQKNLHEIIEPEIIKPKIDISTTFNILDIYHNLPTNEINFDKDKVEDFFDETKKKLLTIQSKINLMEKAIQQDIKDKKTVSFIQLADLIHQDNINKEKLLKQKQQVQDGLFFIFNTKNNDDDL